MSEGRRPKRLVHDMSEGKRPKQLVHDMSEGRKTKATRTCYGRSLNWDRVNVKGGLLGRFKWPKKKELDTANFTPKKFWCLFHIITEYYSVSLHYAT
jgi:hypothetical protein